MKEPWLVAWVGCVLFILGAAVHSVSAMKFTKLLMVAGVVLMTWAGYEILA